MVSTQTRLNPFPGLRPFEAHENDVFFGREGQTDELLRRLRRHRFLAIVGTSGSGKSSLVRAGLLPALFSGFMTQAGSSWRVAVMRPGNDPIANLAQALNHPEVFGLDTEDAPIQTIITETVLRRGALGLVEVVQQARKPSYENLLIVVDQFEELFRFKQNSPRKDSGDEAAAFVKLLLEATQQQELPIYVVLTMRSDFLGDCAQFRDLPETMNDSQYLIPRLTRNQLRAAITGPVGVGEEEMTPRLVNRLINDVGDNPDQLPILQHALMRTWNYHKLGEPIDLQHYEAIGGMDKALSQHADEIYNQLPDERCKKIAEKLFKCLTEKGSDGRGIRRPTKLSEVCAVAEATETAVIDIVEQFRAPGCSFLMPPVGVRLDGNSILDISHESFMRVWQKLKDWVNEEALSARIYRRLAETSALYQEKQAGLWRDPELTIALKWRERNKPNQAWAGRYNSQFERAMQFLDESARTRDAEVAEKERRQKEDIKRRQAEKTRKYVTFALIGGFLVASGLGVAAFFLYREAQQNEIKGLIEKSELLLSLDQKLDPLMEGLKAAIKQQRVAWLGMADSQIRDKNITMLRQAVYQVRERNRLEGHSSGVNSVSFSANGKMIASASSDNTVRLWSVDGKLLTIFNNHNDTVNNVSFSRDGTTLASASNDRTVKLWNVATGKQIRTLYGHNDVVNSVSFSPYGTTLASASGDKTVKLWDLKTGEEIKTLNRHNDVVNSVNFSPDGTTLASASGDKILKLWDLKTGEEIKTLPGHSDALYSVSFSPDGKTLASASVDKTVKLWSIDGQLLTTLKGHNGAVYSVSFSPDGKMIASTSADSTVKLWNTDGQPYTLTLKAQKDRKLILTGNSGAVNSVSFSPDGKIFASTSTDGTVKLWSIHRKLFSTFKGNSSAVKSVSFSADSKTLASISTDGTRRLWNTDGELVAVFKNNSSAANSVSFSPDGKMIASISTDGTLKLGKLLTEFRNSSAVNSVSFSPDGKMITFASADSTVKLWDTNGKLLRTIKGHSDAVKSVSFSPDGKTLASASADGTVKLWSVDGQLLTTLKGYGDAVKSVSFSPDGKTLASVSNDQKVVLWDLNLNDVQKLLVRGCDWVRDYLRTNPNVNESDRHLCDGIGSQ